MAVVFQVKLLAQFFLLTAVAFFTSKALFLLLNSPPIQYGATDLILAWLTGWRFEISSFFILNSVGILLLFISHYHKLLFKACHFWFIGALLWGSWVTLADVFYYQHVNHKLGIETMFFFLEPLSLVNMVLKGYPVVFIALLCSTLLFCGLLYRFTPREIPGDVVARRLRPGWLLLFYCFVVFFSIVAIRGGFQLRPLQVINAYTGKHPYWGDFSIPGIYTSLAMIVSKHETYIPDPGFLEKIEPFQALLGNPKDNFIDKKFPFLRKATPSNSIRRNVFIISLESWSASELGYFGNKLQNTTYFDSLQKEGLFFSNFFANGTRSIVAMPAIAGSLLQTFGEPFTMSSHQTARHVSAPSIFNKLGYHTYFINGSKKGSMNFVDYAALTGFQTITHEGKYPDGEELRDGAWGVYDHIVIDDLVNRLPKAGEQPVFTYLIFNHPHGPYKVPEEYNYYDERTPRHKYLNALRYSDAMLKKLVEGLKAKGYWRNSLFVLTADHTLEQDPGKASFQIPLLLVAPGLIKSGINNTLGSHIDILPTVIDALNINEPHSSMGSSLLTRKASRRVTLDFDTYLGYGDETHLITWSKGGVTGLYNYQEDPVFAKNLKDANPAIVENLASELSLQLSFVNYAKAKNKITPVR